jgi:hypothetical protein
MDEKIFEFKITIYGVEKNFRVHGKDYNDARKKLDARITEKIVVIEHKDVSPQTSKMDEIFEQFGKIFGGEGFGKMFGGK